MGVHIRTAAGWDKGIRKIGNSRLRPDGHKIDYNIGVITARDSAPESSLARLEARLHPRFPTLIEREQIGDLHRDGASLAVCRRARDPSLCSGVFYRSSLHLEM